MKINISDVEALKEALDNPNNKGVFGFTHLNMIAKNFGVKIDELIDKIALLGDIDMFGRTSKTLPQITEQFELIDKAVSDIRENGLITAENLDALLKHFPDLIHYVGQEFNGQSLQEVLEDSQQLKMRKYMASLEGTLATNSDKFKEMSNKFITTDSKDRNI